MRLYNVYGGLREELESREYRIGIGVSLGNPWFEPRNILDLTRWCLRFTRDVVVIYVADTIHAINIEVRKKITPERALQKARHQADQLMSETVKLLQAVANPQERERIKFARWDDLVDEPYREKVTFLETAFRDDGPLSRSRAADAAQASWGANGVLAAGARQTSPIRVGRTTRTAESRCHQGIGL